MNRIDRLTAILLLLQGGKRSASEIAQHFEVSRRTIQRDIDALCEMGIPIVAELGTSGGYTLPPDYSLPPLALTLHEALLLRLALSSLAQLSETPFKCERETLLAKVQTLLPQRERESLDQLAQPLSLEIPARPYATPFLDQLLESARQKQWLAVTYRSEKGVSQQTLLPLRVRTEAGLWYCEAYSHERVGTRVYRVDRFQDLRTTPAPVTGEQPATSVMHTHPTHPEIHIVLTARGLLRLEREPHLSAHIMSAADGTGELRVRLRPEEYDWLVSIVLSLSADARVLAPASLRERMRQETLKIAQMYAESHIRAEL